MKPTNIRTKAPRPTPAEKATQRELRQLYGPPAEWFVDDDSPRHLGAGLTWVDLLGNR